MALAGKRLPPATVPATPPRRRQIADWLERYERLVQTPARSDDERLAKHQALALMEQARPCG